MKLLCEAPKCSKEKFLLLIKLWKLKELLAEYGKIILEESELAKLFSNYLGRITEGLYDIPGWKYN